MSDQADTARQQIADVIERTLKAHDEATGDGVCICGASVAGDDGYDRGLFRRHRCEVSTDALIAARTDTECKTCGGTRIDPAHDYRITGVAMSGDGVLCPVCRGTGRVAGGSLLMAIAGEWVGGFGDVPLFVDRLAGETP